MVMRRSKMNAKRKLSKGGAKRKTTRKKKK